MFVEWIEVMIECLIRTGLCNECCHCKPTLKHGHHNKLQHLIEYTFKMWKYIFLQHCSVDICVLCIKARVNVWYYISNFGFVITWPMASVSLLPIHDSSHMSIEHCIYQHYAAHPIKLEGCKQLLYEIFLTAAGIMYL